MKGEKFTAAHARDAIPLLTNQLSSANAPVLGAEKLTAILTSAGVPPPELTSVHSAAPLVIDVAGGTGAFSLEIAREWPNAIVLCTDFSPAMVEVVRTRPDCPPNVLAATMDAQELKLPDGCVSVLGCTFGMMFMPDRPKAWREMHRVLRPGGRAAIVVIKHSLELMLMNRIREFAGLRELPELAATALALADPAVVEQEAQAAGFGKVTLLELAHVRDDVKETAEKHVAAFAEAEQWPAETPGRVLEFAKQLAVELTSVDQEQQAQYNACWLVVLDKAQG